ncbi:MAG: ATP-binding protein [Myxococcales bacterium]|nr:ATP-binding protein [Myxococcales bacterium]
MGMTVLAMRCALQRRRAGPSASRGGVHRGRNCVKPSATRQFNTAHANRPEQHYTLPPLGQLSDDIGQLVDDSYYLVLHAPRQSGKTTSVMALGAKLRTEGRYAVVFCSVENCRTAKTVADVVNAVVRSLHLAARNQVAAAEQPPDELPADAADPSSRLYAFLQRWCKRCTRPVVLLIDEIDCLTDDGLISVLSQLRQGYAERPTAFPHSVCIFGMRDVRDYKVASGGSERLGTSSPFNIKRESLTLTYFSRRHCAVVWPTYCRDRPSVQPGSGGLRVAPDPRPTVSGQRFGRPV